MSSEVRVVRPYVGVERFQDVLDTCELRLPNHAATGGGTVDVSHDEFVNHPMSLRFDDPDWSQITEGASELDIDLADIDLLVVASSVRLRFTDIVYRQQLHRLESPPEIDLGGGGGDRPRARRAAHGGADIKTFFCLNRSLPTRPLRPWRKGTWLARVTFKLKSDLSGIGFVLIPMTDEHRQRFRIPPEATRFATLDDGDPFDLDPPDNPIQLYVDDELLSRLGVGANTSFGRYLQSRLVVDAMVAIAFAVKRRVDEEPELRFRDIDDDLAGSLVHGLVGLIAGRADDQATAARRRETFWRIVDAPAAFVTEIEAMTPMRTHMLKSFGDGR